MGLWKRLRRSSSPTPAPAPAPAPVHATAPPPSAFPSAYPYGSSSSPGVSYPNPYNDLSHQFNGLSVNGPPQPPPPIRRYTGDASGGPRPPPPPSIPHVLTPGNNQGLRVGEAYQNIDYYNVPLRNPVPRPPALIAIPQPEPYNPYFDSSLQPPPRNHANSAPTQNKPCDAYASVSTGPSAATSPSTPALYPPAATPGRVRASSVPASPTVSNADSGSGVTQCSGVTKANRRCTRLVKASPPLGFLSPDEEIPRYCFQHAKEMLAVTGFYSRKTKDWIDFDAWIPSYLQEGTKVLLRAEMERPISSSDLDGYIYCYELRDTKTPDVINLKVGRAVNLVKRIDEWTKTCESKEPILRGWYPGPDDGDHNSVSLMKGRVKAGSKGKNCHRLERLIHLELADLSVHKPYLTAAFDNDVSKSNSNNKEKPKPKPKKGGKKKASVDDEDDEGDSPPEAPAAARKSKAPRMPVRKPCKDCGAVHKEIFTFVRPKSGAYKAREWEGIVHPVIEKWGGFVDGYT